MIALVRLGKVTDDVVVAVLGAGEGQTGVSLPTVTARRSCDTRYPPFWSASVPSVSARCSVQNWPIGRTPVDAPAGRTVRVCSVRLVSFTHRPVAAICYEVEPVDGPARITVQSELTANEQLPPAGADPGWPRRSRTHCAASTTTPPERPWCWCTRPGEAGCGSAPRWITSSTARPRCGLSPGRSQTAAWSPPRRCWRRARSCG